MGILTSTTPSNGTRNGARAGDAYSLEALGGGVVRLTMSTRLMHLHEARPLCGDIEDASAGHAIRLVVDVGTVGLATPAAMFHGLRTLRHVRIASIALVHAGPAIRRVATLMLTAAGFARFAFFDDEDAAVAWLEKEPEPSGRGTGPRTAPGPSGPRRAAAAAGAALLAGVGGVAAIRAAGRKRRRRRGRGRGFRRDPPHGVRRDRRAR